MHDEIRLLNQILISIKKKNGQNKVNKTHKL